MGKKKVDVAVVETTATEIAAVATTETKPSGLFALVQKKAVELDPKHVELAATLVPDLIKSQEVMSFGTACRTFGFDPHQAKYKIGYLTKLFNKVKEGADALLVGKSGKYGEKVEERHTAWLTANGFTQVQKIR